MGIDVRRVWKCPVCDRVKRLPGDVTAVRCHRSKCNHEWMRLVEPLATEPTGLQIDLSAVLESRDEPEGKTLAPRSAASMAEAIDSVTPPPEEVADAAQPTTTGGEEASEPEPGEAVIESRAESGATDEPATPSGDSPPEAAEGEAKPKRKRRRRRGRRRKPKEGGSSD